MWNTCLLFVLPTLLCLSESITVIGKKKKGRELFNRNSVKLERGIIEKRVKHKGYTAQQGFNNGTIKLHLGDESGVNKNELEEPHRRQQMSFGNTAGNIYGKRELEEPDRRGHGNFGQQGTNSGNFNVHHGYGYGKRELEEPENE